MDEITIYGRSDDLIEVEGDFTEEFPATYDGGSSLAVLAGGEPIAYVSVEYDRNGMWRLNCLSKQANHEHVGIGSFEGCDYSEAVRISSPEELTVEKVW